MKKFISTLLLVLLCGMGFAQPEKPVIEEIDGKKYYVHIVQEGNTLYGLTRLYKTDAEQIIRYNPTAANSIQVGQKIIIPVVAEAPVQQKAPETHTVKKGETLYSISRRYQVKMEDLVQLNPGIENGIDVDQVLKIPNYGIAPAETEIEQAKTQVTFTDSTVIYTVLPHETLYSISKRFMVPVEEIQAANQLKNNKIRKGDIINIPVKKAQVKKIEVRKVEDVSQRKPDEDLTFKPKNTYNIVYLLPFGLDGGNEPLKNLATEFYMGSKLALDSLEKMGLKAKVTVLDVTSDTAKLRSHLASKELAAADVIIGPFTSRNVEIAAVWAKEHQIRMISPLVSSTAALKDNRFVYNAVNSDMSLMTCMARHVADTRSGEQIILVKVDQRDMDLYQAFRQEFLKITAGKGNIKLIETDSKELFNFIRKSGNTTIIVPSRDKGFATKFINNLNQNAPKSANITLYATKDWANNDDIKGYYKNRFNLHYASPYDFNYSYDATKKIHLRYRSLYNADLSRFGVQGFDVTLYFLTQFCLKRNLKTEVMNQFDMRPVTNGSGYENKTCYILKQEDYEIKQVAIIHE